LAYSSAMSKPICLCIIWVHLQASVSVDENFSEKVAPPFLFYIFVLHFCSTFLFYIFVLHFCSTPFLFHSSLQKWTFIK
jgi:hypothetical protein